MADEYLSDGITEEIIGALARVKGIKVPARTSSFAFKGKNQDIRVIGEQLGVTTVLEEETSRIAPGFVPIYEYMGYMYWLKGDMQKAVESYRKAAELGNYTPHQRAQLAWIYAVAGKKAEALKAVAEVRPNPDTGFLPATQVAMAYTALGEKDLAFQYLEQAFEQRSYLLMYLKTGRHWEPLRSDPRFTSLLHKTGF